MMVHTLRKRPRGVLRKTGWVAGLLAATVAPAWAIACPVCATREGPGAGTLALIAGMIAVPYFVAAFAIKIIRRIDEDTAGERSGRTP